MTHELDRWVLSRLQRLIAAAHGAFENYEHYRLIEAFQLFDDEFSNWYLRRSRRRFWKSEPEAYRTLYTVLTTVTRVMAPALPFLTEEIYQNLVRSVDPAAPESVHLTRLPRGGRIANRRDARARHRRGDPRQEPSAEPADPEQGQDPAAAGYSLRAAARRSRPRVLENPNYTAQIVEEANIKRMVLIEDETAAGEGAREAGREETGPASGPVSEIDWGGARAGRPGPWTVEVDGRAVRRGAGRSRDLL